MKVLSVTHAFPPESVGGTERYARFAAQGLARRGHQVEVFSGSLEWRESFEVVRETTEGLPITRIHRDDLYFDHWDKIQAPPVAAAFEQVLDRFQPDVLHLHHWIRLSFDLVRRAAARRVPSVVHLHDLFTTCPRVFRIRQEDESCDRPVGVSSCLHCVPRWEFQGDPEITASLEAYVDRVGAELDAAGALLAPTASHARYLEQGLGRPEGAIQVLEHPDLRQAAWQGRCADSPAGRLRVLYFAHLHPIKGAHVLLEALRSLGPNSGVEMDCYGAFATPDYEARLRGLAEGLPVRFHGAYSSDEPAQTPADVVAVPSLARESHSFWLDEALCTGHPVLVSRLGALAERGGGRVRSVERAEAPAWAEALRELRDDPSQRERLRRAPTTLPGEAAAHLEALEARLRHVVERGAPAVSAPPDPAELQLEWQRREWAFRELLRSQGWERLLGEAHQELQRSRRSPSAADEGGRAPEGPAP